MWWDEPFISINEVVWIVLLKLDLQNVSDDSWLLDNGSWEQCWAIVQGYADWPEVE